MKVNFSLSLEEKLQILSDAAKYDVACTSSGSDRRGKKGSLGNSCAAGICHSFAADGRCISLLKVLLSNECVYDCKYCLNRRSNDKVRTTFTPEELCSITMEFYKRNYIEGLFLSSGVIKNPTHTMELIYQTLYLLRTKYHFRGYIHAKAVPGASPEIIEQTGYLADRMSINMELPTEKSLHTLAPGKTQQSIVKPMAQIQGKIIDYRLSLGKTASMERFGQNQYLSSTIFTDTASTLSGASSLALEKTAFTPRIQNSRSLSVPIDKQKKRPFVPAGQSTQMIVGATPETDYQMLHVAETLYQRFDLKRVFYSAFVSVNVDKALPAKTDQGPPLLREHRLYQADWLLRYYKFEAKELLTEEEPNFNPLFDPKCNWALRHLEYFPVEVNRAPYEMLLRVPGLGYRSAGRIVRARRLGTLDFQDLKKIGVVLKRAMYFLTCNGRMMYPVKLEQDYIARNLLDAGERLPQEVRGMTYQQLSLFDDVRFGGGVNEKNLCV